MPFLQIVLGHHVPILPVAVGVAETEWVADLLGALLGSGAFLIVSTDLSHYHADATAKAQDRRTAAAITARDPDAIGRDDACGVFALRGALEWARRADLAVGLLDLRTSADTAGDPSRVVGYGSLRAHAWSRSQVRMRARTASRLSRLSRQSATSGRRLTSAMKPPPRSQPSRHPDGQGHL